MRVKFDPESNTLHIPEVEGVTYMLDGEPVDSGSIVLDHDVVVAAVPQEGYRFPEGVHTERKITVKAVEG